MNTPLLQALRALVGLGSTRVDAFAFACVVWTCALAVSVASVADAGEATPSANTEENHRILILGDSISAAYGMSLEQGWAALMERRMQATYPSLQIINASISGDTTGGGLRRLPGLLAEHAPHIVVIELGGNDGLRGYPTNKLTENLTTMARLAIDAGAEALLLPMEIPPNYGPRYTAAFRASFVEAAQQSGAQLGPFILQDIATRDELMQADGIHPTREAQPMIVDTLQPLISKLLDQTDI